MPYCAERITTNLDIWYVERTKLTRKKSAFLKYRIRFFDVKMLTTISWVHVRKGVELCFNSLETQADDEKQHNLLTFE